MRRILCNTQRSQPQVNQSFHNKEKVMIIRGLTFLFLMGILFTVPSWAGENSKTQFFLGGLVGEDYPNSNSGLKSGLLTYGGTAGIKLKNGLALGGYYLHYSKSQTLSDTDSTSINVKLDFFILCFKKIQ